MINQAKYELGATRSCIRELFEYGRQRAALVGSENVFDYSLGNPSIPSPAQVDETIAQLLQDTPSIVLHGYTSAVGDLQTRLAIAQDLNQRYNAHVSPEELFITCGAAPALCAVLQALGGAGRKVLALAPYFPEYKPFTQAAGSCFEVVPPDVPDFQIPFDALSRQLTEDTVAVIVNSPNNPAGTVYTSQTLEKLAALLTEKSRAFGHPIYIISDEPYRELVYEDACVPFVPQIYPNTVVCYSYSKSLSLPGERIGYVYVPGEAEQSRELYLAVAGSARAAGHVCAPGLWQKVIARCAHLRPDLASYDKNRRTLYDALTEIGYEVAKPQGAFYLFVRAPGGDAQAFSSLAMKSDLLLVPGDAFGCPGWFRICYCVDYSQIVRSLPIFRQLYEAVQTR